MTTTNALLLSLGLFTTTACGEAGDFDGGFDDSGTSGDSAEESGDEDVGGGEGDDGHGSGGGEGGDGNADDPGNLWPNGDGDDDDDDDDDDDGQTLECQDVEVELVAGQEYDAGWVTVTITDAGLEIDIDAAAPWRLHQVHIHAGPFSPASNPGSYRFSEELDYADGYTLVVPFADLRAGCGDEVAVAVHAEVSKPITEHACQEETAWGEGEFSFDVGWGSWFEVPVCCD